jgi:hypothetical protein
MTLKEKNREASRLAGIADKLGKKVEAAEEAASKAVLAHEGAVKAWRDFVLANGPQGGDDETDGPDHDQVREGN